MSKLTDKFVPGITFTQIIVSCRCPCYGAAQLQCAVTVLTKLEVEVMSFANLDIRYRTSHVNRFMSNRDIF